jgi:hypothetical protein
MKIKTTFITNSSSASFTILKHHLNELQIALIYDHIEIAYLASRTCKINRKPTTFNKKYFTSNFSYYDKWRINEDEKNISGYTSMDDFDMYWFLTQILRIKEEHIVYDDSNY